MYCLCNTSVTSWLYFCSVNGGQTIFLVDTEVWIKKVDQGTLILRSDRIYQ